MPIPTIPKEALHKDTVNDLSESGPWQDPGEIAQAEQYKQIQKLLL